MREWQKREREKVIKRKRDSDKRERGSEREIIFGFKLFDLNYHTCIYK